MSVLVEMLHFQKGTPPFAKTHSSLLEHEAPLLKPKTQTLASSVTLQVYAEHVLSGFRGQSESCVHGNACTATHEQLLNSQRYL